MRKIISTEGIFFILGLKEDSENEEIEPNEEEFVDDSDLETENESDRDFIDDDDDDDNDEDAANGKKT